MEQMPKKEIYTSAVSQIKQAILSSQYQAAKGVNAIQLSLYYGIGKYVSDNTRQGVWGTGAIASISERLQKELPGLRGFGEANIKFMRQFYETWHEVIDKSLIAVSDLQNAESTGNTIIVNSLTAFSELSDIQEFLSLGFSLHMMIIRQTKDAQERLFYIHQAVTKKWNRGKLKAELANHLYEHRDQLPNNFLQTISNKQSALKAIEMFKDEYLLDFINVEELGERDKDDIDERVVEKAIIHNVKNFIMTFGHDFTFVGNQYHLEVYSEDFYPDLLFFNRELNALVVVDLKKGKFKPSYLGQLSTYLRIIDDKVKKAHENPTIGLILCKEANKDLVQYVIQDYNKPMGVATYSTSADMPDDLRNALPDIDDLKKLL